MKHEDNPRSIKYYVKRYLLRNKDRFKAKTVVDFPSGNGTTSRILRSVEANPVAFDLFPEYFNVEGLSCTRANIADGIPFDKDLADYVICQEGLEHFSDQLGALKEFNRILKRGGGLIITTPNYSNLGSKISYLLSESEKANSVMAPNELDSIWMNKQDISSEIYYGHIFLTGILKLRCMATLAGFKLKHVERTRVKKGSLAFLIILYPLIVISNYITYKKNLRKDSLFSEEIKHNVYKEIFNLSISPKILTDANIFVEFEKISDTDEVANIVKSQHKEFGTT